MGGREEKVLKLLLPLFGRGMAPENMKLNSRKNRKAASVQNQAARIGRAAPSRPRLCPKRAII
jgi:hypothetical protein